MAFGGEGLLLCSRGDHCAINRRKDCAGVIEEHAPCRQECHAPWRALEELRADLVFERSDVPADRRLRDVQALGRAPDVALFGNSDEVADLRKAHVGDRDSRREPDQGAEAA